MIKVHLSSTYELLLYQTHQQQLLHLFTEKDLKLRHYLNAVGWYHSFYQHLLQYRAYRRSTFVPVLSQVHCDFML